MTATELEFTLLKRERAASAQHGNECHETKYIIFGMFKDFLLVNHSFLVHQKQLNLCNVRVYAGRCI